MFTDPVGDMIARVRNAQQRRKASVLVPFSKLKEALLKAFVQEGYVSEYEVVGETAREKALLVKIKYYRSRPVIRGMRRVSKPSVPAYRKARELVPVLSGLGNDFLTTSKGVLSDRAAREQRVGGQVLVRVW